MIDMYISLANNPQVVCVLITAAFVAIALSAAAGSVLKHTKGLRFLEERPTNIGEWLWYILLHIAIFLSEIILELFSAIQAILKLFFGRKEQDSCGAYRYKIEIDPSFRFSDLEEDHPEEDGKIRSRAGA